MPVTSGGDSKKHRPDIYDGFFPQLKDMIMGHEFMGIVEETGLDVNNIRKGDWVAVPFPIACDGCFSSP